MPMGNGGRGGGEQEDLITNSVGRCSFPSMPSDEPSWVMEQAVEELRVLEAQHSSRHGCLKLRAFISDSLRSFPSLPATGTFTTACPALASTCSAATQESSHRKRRKRGVENQSVATADATGQKLQEEPPSPNVARDSVDVALERAEHCLRKIRRVKEMLARGC